MKSLVKIMPKKGVLDPQGKAIENSLKQLGFSQIKEVTQGKIIEIEIDSDNEKDAREILEKVSNKLLANLVIEDYEITFPKED
ncbi:phosphoribosylformylglycinamidine synthase subunit PurS [Hyphomicrobiales bacterium]|nr:phosphoribosylformylglycinamidine synthase [Rhodobiaceae bacterium]MDC0184471.1 phosphoribosylformylglycinamidine synthase subunit PurS [Rhodobiaceae bacterium]MDC3320733.1 phosphoribosylformylglycinamidine synthase subunit PurS [Hyphomicrobiales bacterium]|tara:strand:- start:16909 stop:17157 length:249 start_codon:yes stop_codon:yes gene_type:complete